MPGSQFTTLDDGGRPRGLWPRSALRSGDFIYIYAHNRKFQKTKKERGPGLNDGWSKIGAAAEIAKEDLVAQAYAEEYKQRYGVEPIWSFDGTDHTVIKDTVRKVGEKRARQLLRAFVRMNDSWFVERGHSLDCFKKNLARVNAFLGSKLEQASENRSLFISAHGGISCDRCFGYYEWVGKPVDLSGLGDRLCPGCRERSA